MLNLIWVGFFLVAFASALFQFFIGGQPDIFAQMMKAGFDNARGWPSRSPSGSRV